MTALETLQKYGLNLAVLSKSDGVNAKGQMAEIIKGILEKDLKEMESEVVVK